MNTPAFTAEYSLYKSTAGHIAALNRAALSEVRNIVEVIFSFTNRATDVVEKQFLRVDVTEEFPFLVTKLSPYYDR
jgi:PatG C-terminal